MLTLVTGSPGSSKTLSTIDELRTIKDRPIFYVGIKDLKLDWTEIKDPYNYHKELPDGSIIVFDEVQQYFPVRPPKNPVPPALTFLETHRHHGIDVYFITQHQNLLDHHARRLVGKHIHLQRNFGLNRAVKYTHNQLFDPKNYHEVKNCLKEQYKFPTDVYNLYHSAEVHTTKPKLPLRILLIPFLLIVVLTCVYFFYNLLFNKEESSPISINSLVPSNLQSPSLSTRSKINWNTAFTPALEGLPYTAPLYSKIAKPTTIPIVSGCVSDKQKCRCYTQQGTRITMSVDLCRVISSTPQFNPFKEKRNNNSIAPLKRADKSV